MKLLFWLGFLLVSLLALFPVFGKLLLDTGVSSWGIRIVRNEVR